MLVDLSNLPAELRADDIRGPTQTHTLSQKPDLCSTNFQFVTRKDKRGSNRNEPWNNIGAVAVCTGQVDKAGTASSVNRSNMAVCGCGVCW